MGGGGCRTEGIGCIECKAKMADHLIEWIAPVRERRVEYEQNRSGVLEIFDSGSRKARVVASGTMERVREGGFRLGRRRGKRLVDRRPRRKDKNKSKNKN